MNRKQQVFDTTVIIIYGIALITSLLMLFK